MSYQVLARKWRPKTFQAMVGQEHIMRMLTNALERQRLHHAYLFTGTRGVGKTTLARILAKCLNCESGITPAPCGTCTNCTAIDTGRFLDLLEVDAASRTKVEETRELLDNIHYQPTQGRYKIYLIDEVHMLSGHSFNALLKTLEEPPSYVKFLLATTDPKRLPITVLSRCLQFNLKRVPEHQINSHLQFICQEEIITFENPALSLLATAADGSMRDALSLLDQAIAYCGENLTETDVRHMLGSVPQEALYRLIQALAAKDGKQLLTEVSNLADNAINFFQALEELLSLFHQMNVLQIVPDLSQDNTPLKTLSQQFRPEDIQLYYQIGVNGRRDLPFMPSPHQGFEMILLRMLAFEPALLEAKISPIITTTPEKISEKKTVTPTIITPPKPKIDSQSATNSQTTRAWGDLLTKLGLTGMAYALAANCTLLQIIDGQLTLALAAQHEPMLNKKLVERIEQALENHFKKPFKLEIKITTQDTETPVKQQQHAHAARHAAATDAIKNDNEVQKIMGLFDATLDLDSIKLVQ